eukprot:m.6297 g.6297  ORF g.6297 m.6297 type:complete len:291 (+) comp2597_c0_seq1:115-987(+)
MSTGDSPAPTRPITVLRSIAYVEAKTPGFHSKHHLDIYKPDAGDGRGSGLRPVVMHVHGGGWQRGDRGRKFYGAPYIGRKFAEAGIVAVCPSYRLSGFPENIHDIASAFAWTVKHIAEYGGDPKSVFVCGHSAGAHLVALLAVDPYYLTRAGLTSASLRGVIAISGIYNLRKPFHQDRKMAHWFFRRFYIHRSFGEKADADVASPAAQATLCPKSWRLAPMLLLNAKRDLGLDHDGLKFYEILQTKDVEVRHVMLDMTHFSITISQETVDVCQDFIWRTASSPPSRCSYV